MPPRGLSEISCSSNCSSRHGVSASTVVVRVTPVSTSSPTGTPSVPSEPRPSGLKRQVCTRADSGTCGGGAEVEVARARALGTEMRVLRARAAVVKAAAVHGASLVAPRLVLERALDEDPHRESWRTLAVQHLYMARGVGGVVRGAARVMSSGCGGAV